MRQALERHHGRVRLVGGREDGKRLRAREVELFALQNLGDLAELLGRRDLFCRGGRDAVRTRGPLVRRQAIRGEEAVGLSDAVEVVLEIGKGDHALSARRWLRARRSDQACHGAPEVVERPLIQV